MPRPKPQVRIVSDGSPWGTTIEVDGKPLTCVRKVIWELGLDERATATLELDEVAVEVTGELTKAELAKIKWQQPGWYTEGDAIDSEALAQEVEKAIVRRQRRAGTR